jgi:hypothetical protein
MLAQVSMHLRGPMNVSQLAVYQLPADVHTLRKRKTVPFYNRRRALHQQDASTLARGSVSPSNLPVGGRTNNSRSSCSPSTVTATATVTECNSLRSTSTASMGLDTTERSVYPRAASDWSRVGHYTSAAPAQATGLSFLANLGDPRRSGTFD